MQTVWVWYVGAEGKRLARRTQNLWWSSLQTRPLNPARSEDHTGTTTVALLLPPPHGERSRTLNAVAHVVVWPLAVLRPMAV